MTGRYARTTDVSVSKSKMEIEALLEKYGADAFMSGFEENRAFLAFRMNNRHIKFVLPLPDRDDREFTHSSRGKRNAETAMKHWEQACRSRWRALKLCIQAKLEAVDVGISTFDDEFLANIVLPDGQTMGQYMAPQIERAYQSGNMPPLLPDYRNVSS